ncbi:uncharacterized protein [Primulina eburnea]|uniref:uncharacterized protein n=1 Tax=Primulina eburnea TaxID=1245227 RepID=UPI003C6C004D
MAASLSEDNTREVLHVTRLILSTEEEVIPMQEDSWMTDLIKFIAHNKLPEDRDQAQKIKKQAPIFVLLNKILYRISYQGPLLKFLAMEEVEYVLREIHEGCCGEHLERTVLSWEAILAGFWWTSIGQNSSQVVRACEWCQHHSNFQHSPTTPMKPILAYCPFDQWALKTRLQGKEKDWVEELPSVLWAYRTTPRAPKKLLSILFMVLKQYYPWKLGNLPPG